MYGRVTDANGRPIAHASIEVWQPDENGFYDLQKQDPSEMELRGRFFSDEAGLYHFRTIKPRGYKIPMDGPVGDMVRAQGRHGWRPAHIHFLVGAPGYSEAITALYMADDEHIDSDTVFGANESLITEPKPNGLGIALRNASEHSFRFHARRSAKFGGGCAVGTCRRRSIPAREEGRGGSLEP